MNGFGWLEELFVESLSGVVKEMGEEGVKAIRATDPFRRGEKRYCEYVHGTYGKIQVLGMSRPIWLSDLYINIRVNENIKRKLPTLWNVPKDSEDLYFKQVERKRLEGIRDPILLLKKCDRIAILGKPGCGKTTFFKYISLLQTNNIKESNKTIGKYLPILIILRSIQGGEVSLFDILLQEIKRCGFPYPKEFLHSILKKGRAIVMLDGLDELEGEQEEFIRQSVSDLVALYPKNKFIVSCRSAAYERGYEGFVELEVEDFEQVQKYTFVEDWFGKQSTKDDLIRHLKSNHYLSDLCSNPLMLTLVCLLYEHDFEIPKSKIDLYKRCLSVMLHEWDRARGFRRVTAYEKLSDQRKLRLLGYVAARLFVDEKKVFARGLAEKIIAEYIPKMGIDSSEAGGILREIESHHGIIISISTTQYTFSHLTFQEYLTASHMVDARKEYESVWHASDPRWLEVISIIAGSLEDSTEFVEQIISARGDRLNNLCLAAYCISCDISISMSLKDRIVSELVTMLGNSSRIIAAVTKTHKSRTGAQFGIKINFHKYAKDRSILRALVVVNMLSSILNTSFLNDIKRYLQGNQKKKFYKVLSIIDEALEKQSVLTLYSNKLNIPFELPIDLGACRRRVASQITRNADEK